jgi:hypothetical protein
MDDDFNDQIMINNRVQPEERIKFNINQQTIEVSHKTLWTFKNILGNKEITFIT